MTDTQAPGEDMEEAVGQIVSADMSTSAKIRALGEMGLERTAIRDLLGIRYQHVRKVLLDAGITSGARPRSSRANASESAGTKLVETLPAIEWQDLLAMGFVAIGEWSLTEEGIVLDGLPPSEPGVYAFILDGRITYVGLTQNALRARMGHYRLGHVRQKTSARVNGLIREALAGGSRVHVLTCIPGSIEWNGLTLHIAPSLEAALIGRIRPPWNIHGKRGPA